MKKQILSLITLFCALSSIANDFKVGSLFFTILDGDNHTVTVSARNPDLILNRPNPDDEKIVRGHLVIPEKVLYNGLEYSVVEILPDGFSECINLISVEIPKSVTTIGANAFSYCSSLTSVEIPNSVTSIGYGAFANCTSLTGIKLAYDNPYYSLKDGVLFNKDVTEIIYCPTEKKWNLHDTDIGNNDWSLCFLRLLKLNLR